MMMVMCNKQHLKVKQHWGWVEKNIAYKKTCSEKMVNLRLLLVENKDYAKTKIR